MVTLAWLHDRGPEGVARLLRERPDAATPAPSTLAELAARLNDPGSVDLAVGRLDRATLQVASALIALGHTPERARLDRLLGVDGADGEGGSARRDAVDRAVARLDALGLLDDDGRLLGPAAAMIAGPGGLGPPASTLLRGQPVETLRALSAVWGEPPTRSDTKVTLTARLVSALRDDERVRQRAAQVPPAYRPRIEGLVINGGAVYHPSTAGGAWRKGREADGWLIENGLALRDPQQHVYVLPAEVGLALRGAGWTAPFDHDRPLVSRVSVDAAFVTREAQAASARAASLAADLFATLGRQPATVLKEGGVGVRELRRLAKLLKCTPGQVRLLLDLGWRSGLLAFTGRGLLPTSEYDGWLKAQPGDRLALLLRAWWLSPAIAMLADDEALRPGYAATIWSESVRIDWLGIVVRAVRSGLLFELGREPGRAPADLDAVVRALTWQAPRVVPALGDLAGPDEPDEPDGRAGCAPALGALIEEARFLGVVASTAITSAGAALVAGDREALTTALARVSRLESSVRLQADLTAVVLGSPDASLTALLDEVADREGAGSAGVWRISPASVRRAFDGGLTADMVLQGLASVAPGGVPQPVEYLIRDVARRHGSLRARTVTCILHSSDTALVAEIVADRTLAALGLQLVAPTVVASGRPVAETLELLRRHGYLPVEEDQDGSQVLARAVTHRAPARDADRGRRAAVLEDLLDWAGAGSSSPLPDAALVGGPVALASVRQPRPPTAEELALAAGLLAHDGRA